MTREIFVLSVLHDLHARYEDYTYDHIRKILAAYNPDLVCIEVGPRRFAACDFRVYSSERWGVILPWALNRGIPVAGVDGDGKSAERDREAVRKFRQTEEGRRLSAELIDIQNKAFGEAGGVDPLISSYVTANSAATQAFFRKMYRELEAKAGHLFDGALIGRWTQRNQGMFKRTLDAMDLHEAKRVIVPVGGAHKYALDDLFAGVPGLHVLQLDDFLSTPIELSEEEREAFRRGDHRISYPSDLMYVHHEISGGEPNAYSLDLPDNPDSIDVEPIRRRIDECLSVDPQNTNMIYYRGIAHYLRREYSQAVDDFRRAAEDRNTRISVIYPLWELSLLREGQMHDIVGERLQALSCYRRIQNEGSGLVLEMAEPFLDRPFERPPTS